MSQEARPGSRLRPLTIQEVNDGADAAVQDAIGAVWVVGEISRFTAHRSGHWYFSLADGKAVVSCAMFRGRNQRVRFQPEVGVQVLALGNARVYVPQGRFQLIVEALEPFGQGAAALARERLRKKLEAEGLFAPERKRRIPAVCRRIGVVTSPTGAAVRDVLKVLRRRFASVSVLLAPAAVQGEEAPGELVRALAALDRCELDVLLLVRGGGAREDLAAFDDERVVRAVAGCRTPVVTGVGHEIDTSLADLAADRQAPTPSAAAEVVVREQRELRDRLASHRAAMARAMRYRLSALAAKVREAEGARSLGRVPLRVERARMRLAELDVRLERAVRDRISRGRTRLREIHLDRLQVDRLIRLRTRLADTRRRLSPQSLRVAIGSKSRRVDGARWQIAAALRRRVGRERDRLSGSAARLDALSPLKVLDRGYALAQRDGPKGAVVRDAAQLSVGDTLYVRFAAGAARADVHDVEPAGEKESRG